ncbi:MAG: LapA family protein [bacterium]
MNWKWFVVIILLIILVIFTAQNYEVCEIKFLVWSFQTSRSIGLFISMVIGVIIGWVTASHRKQ